MRALDYVLKHSLFKGSVIYFMAIGINSLISFFLVPVLTRYLTPYDYGVVSTIQIFISILGIFLCLGIDNSIPVNYVRYERKTFDHYLKNVIYLIIFNFVVIFLCILIFRETLAGFVEVPVPWLIISVASLIGTPFFSIAVMLLIAKEKVLQRSIFIIVQTVISAGLSLYFIVICRMNWEGRLLGIVSASLIIGFLGLIIIFRQIGTGLNSISFHHIKHALSFGTPMVPYAISGQVMFGINRFFINSMLDISQTGIYSVAHQMGMMVSYLGSSFNTVWMPFFYRKLNENNDISKLKIVKLTYAVSALIMSAALIWGIGSPFILKYLLGKDFHQASRYVIWIALGYGFESIYSILSGYIYFSQKTYLLTIIGVSCALANMLLTYVLISLNGLTGAAQATFLTYLAFFVLSWIVSQKICKMPWNLRTSNA
jgi:O-antigen/teichoic acid export membrane protein